MKNSFEWKKNIEDKITEKRESIARRKEQMRTVCGMSLALLVCLGCSFAVIRFARINKPPVNAGNEIVSTSQDKYDLYSDVPGDSFAAAGDSAAVGTELPSYTAADWTVGSESTGEPPSATTGDITYVPSTEPVITGKDDDTYPVTTGGDVFETTSPKSNRLQVDEIINRAFHEKLQFPDATEYTKTFATALEYYGLSDLNIAPSLRGGTVYRIDFSDNYTFLVDDNGASFGIVVRDDITVNYVSDDNDAYYQLSMGCVSLPYDWMFTTAENNTFEYRGVEVKTGYINGNGIGAELMVADYEYNGIKFRFSGHNVLEKEFIACLYNVIDCLFRR